MSVHNISFNVNDVTPVSPSEIYKECEMKTPEKILSKLLEVRNNPSYEWGPEPLPTEPFLEAAMEPKGKYYKTRTNSFFSACSTCYANHLPLEIDVDHVKLTITQAFAIHVNENAESLRKLLVKHDGKKNISIIRDEFVRGQKNNWNGVFGEFASKVREDINDSDLVELIQTPTQTTTEDTMAALNISVLDAFQKFYDYTMFTKCGIPSITLNGSVDDWMSLKSLLNCMEKYDFKWYTYKMQHIIDEFISAASGTPKIAFWKDMVKYNNESGGPYYHGWIKYLFPYIKDNGTGGYVRSKFDNYISSNNIPSGISSVPINWIYYGETIELKFHTGFTCLEIRENNRVTPGIIWGVQDVKKSKNNYIVPDKLVYACLNGTLYDPAKSHYGRETRVICDVCAKDTMVCIGYGENNDFCLDCLDMIRNKYGGV